MNERKIRKGTVEEKRVWSINGLSREMLLFLVLLSSPWSSSSASAPPPLQVPANYNKAFHPPETPFSVVVNFDVVDVAKVLRVRPVHSSGFLDLYVRYTTIFLFPPRWTSPATP